MSIGHAPTTATEQAPPPAGADGPSGRAAHPVRSMLAHRGVSGLFSVIAVAIIVYFATLVLPGDAAQAILGKQATPQRLALLRHQLHLDQPPWEGFLHWAGGALHGDFGTSLVNQQSVTSLVGPRLLNSLALVLLTAVISSVLGVVLGAISALRADKASDHVMSSVALVASALPEFVVGIFVVLVLAVEIKAFPAISILPPGETIWQQPNELVLPVLTLVIVTTPYVFRMSRASILEALHSDYAELAQLKGASPARLLFRHALPNSMAPTVQVIGLNLLYLAGGIVLVETVFQYPGVGLALVNAIDARDVPTIQFIVLVLAVFYVLLNILTDLIVLLLTPRRRLPR
jgi:peptide/nickel transport system permease protein